MDTMGEFGAMLLKEWKNPDPDVADPVIIIEDQVLARRGPGGGMTYHVTVVSQQWPESTPEERAQLVKNIGEIVDSRMAKYTTKSQGLTAEEAEALGLNITFAHPEFDIYKPHDSVEGTFGSLPEHARGLNV